MFFIIIVYIPKESQWRDELPELMAILSENNLREQENAREDLAHVRINLLVLWEGAIYKQTNK